MSTRSRRNRRSSSSNDKIFEDIAKLRSGGGTTRADVYKSKKESDVYDLVTEQEYSELVAKRREEGLTDFIVDDGDDLGYADDGEEDDWEVKGEKRRAISKVAREVKRHKKEAARATKRVDAMLLGGRKDGYLGPESAGLETMEDDGNDEVMQKLLSELDAVAEEEEEETPSGGRQLKLEDMAQFGQQCELENAELEYVEEGEEGQTQTKRVRKVKLEPNSMEDALFGTSTSHSAVKQEMDDEGIMPDFNYKENQVPKPITVKMEPQSGKKKAPKKLQAAPAGAKKASTGTDWYSVSSKVTSGKTKATATAETSVPDMDTDQLEGLKFFCYDIHEEAYAQPGTVFMFGKIFVPGTKTMASCCVRVDNIDRNLFVVPRAKMLADPDDPASVTDQEVGMQDVWGEIKACLATFGVKSFKSKPVQRRYCFARDNMLHELDGSAKDTSSLLDAEMGIPPETEYLKVVYPYKSRNIPRDITGRTFSAVLGSRASARETFIMKRDIMGPEWLHVADCVPVEKEKMLSYCKYEFVVSNQKSLKKLMDAPATPPLSVLSLSLQTMLNAQHRNEILVATGMFHPEVSIEGNTKDENKLEHFTIVRNVNGKSLPLDFKSAVKKKNLMLWITPNERALLGLLISKISAFDPDVITGHDLHGFQFETLMHRMNASKIPKWAKFGRLKKVNMPNMIRAAGVGGKSFSLVDCGMVAGRILCDTLVASKEFLGRESNYSLTHLAESQLKVNRKEVDPVETGTYFSSTKKLLELVGFNENDAFLTLQLMFKLVVLPLTKTLTCLCGNIWNRSLRSARAERVEYLLLHEFHKLKFIAPEKFTGKEIRALKAAKDEARGIVTAKGKGRKRGKPQYAGGLVLEPKKGFYDKFVLLLDFNSLYPSIIREFNICFTTVKHWQHKEEGVMADLPEEGAKGGILPRVVTRLLERRKAVKKMIKSERNDTKRKQLDIRQLALKLVANSMYGCLGFQSSRFFCQPLAAMITSQGRDILQKTVDLTNSLGYPVIYGDTDSIMVNTNQLDLKAVKEIGKTIKKEVNKRYNILEIELDGVFKNMLLLRKKKYACLTVVERPDGAITAVKEMKGLDLVRRDWSKLSKDTGDFVLNEILSHKAREEVVENIHSYLIKLKDDVNNNKLPLEKYIIYKCLTKAPNDYPDKQNQPHVMVALKMIEGGKTVRVGDHIPYIITKVDGEKSMAKRAEHPDVVEKAQGSIAVDAHWYLSNQVLPPTARLLDPIEETDAGRIADCLGLDSRKFHKISKTDGNDDDDVTVPVEDEEDRYRDCDNLEVKCPTCDVKFTIGGVYKPETKNDKAQAVTPATSAVQPLETGLKCPTVGCPGFCDKSKADGGNFATIANAITLATRGHVAKYYKGWYRCSDYPTCPNRTQDMSTVNNQCAKCQTGVLCKEYSAKELYTQLSYFQWLFDVDKARKKLRAKANRDIKAGKITEEPQDPLTVQEAQICKRIYSHVEETMRKSAYHYVSFSSLYSFMYGRK